MKTQTLLFSVWLPKVAYYRAKYHTVPFIERRKRLVLTFYQHVEKGVVTNGDRRKRKAFARECKKLPSTQAQISSLEILHSIYRRGIFSSQDQAS